MKAAEDFLSSDTYRAIKGMSLAEMSHYMYALYSAGYAAGLADAGGEKLREIVQTLMTKIEAVKAASGKKDEAKPKSYAPEGQEENWA